MRAISSSSISAELFATTGLARVFVISLGVYGTVRPALLLLVLELLCEVSSTEEGTE